LGEFVVPIQVKEPNDVEPYLLFTHNCTDSWEVIEERFTLSSFAQRRVENFTTLSQGYAFAPLSSHDTALTRALTVQAVLEKRERDSVPMSVFVEGESVGDWRGDSPSIKLVGRLYNWDYEAMPQRPKEHEETYANSTTKVALHFDGRVKVGVGEHHFCSGARLALHRAGRKIM